MSQFNHMNQADQTTEPSFSLSPFPLPPFSFPNAKLSIRNLDLKNKKVLIRVDFNVPLARDENGQIRITDDSRIRASLPTIRYVIEHGGAAILMSHLASREGPKGKPDPQFSLKPCAKRLFELLSSSASDHQASHQSIHQASHQPSHQFSESLLMAPDCIGPEVEKMAKALKPGQILLLENLRFHPGEERPAAEPAFIGSLASLGDLYVNDAFSSSHRSHASTTEIARFFPRSAAMGLLMEKEIAYLGSTLLSPKRPFCAILGGAKVSTKFKVIEALMQKADTLLIGGAMAYTFLKGENFSVGRSFVEHSFLGVAREIMDVITQSRCRILLPTDLVVAREVRSKAEQKIVSVKEGIPDGFEGVDIGPETIRRYTEEIQKSATIFWNGPLGVFECPPFDKGTNAIAKALADATPLATTIVGGGDSAAALAHAGFTGQMSHISTGGGAALEYIEFGQLPGIQALSDF